ncbi:M20/M25/M40 family metallo-hydrolase [Pontibacter sp. JH31]|uniref:M20/M25/M40 family metallo-hydrolase n=1 Tax=Pontibacter aquaedesilientis TaxID=2766980 RepID=A0ABR7XHT7_9BACT|nr:M20/M25/M40 family metallo-hydrolase [Pontibacter aquaedesilientis]MBD1397859.1 M20/M25/M40 family metallo-hydrolase [Pontibacter aquaedesilientis]
MIRKKLFVTAFSLLMGASLSAQDLSVINQQEATRLLQTLSHDDMQGRATFTAGIEKAATFIETEFSAAGLLPLKGGSASQAPSFRQTFYVHRLTPSQTEVNLDNIEIAAEHLFVNTSQKQLDWNQKNKVDIITISKGKNFRAAFAKVNSQEQDAIVLVHPSHAEAFQDYRGYFAKGAVKKEIGTGSSKVYVLTDQANPKKYQVKFENKIDKLELSNVVGMIEGKRKNEFVVFSGHYDHIGFHKSVDGDSIANGADDDASGTTAMMMLARYYKQQVQPERTLIFAAFTAEEIGGHGSRYFSEQLNPDQIVAMFNIEMVGKPSRFGPNSAYLTGFEKSDLGLLMQKRLKGTTYSIHPDPYPKQNLFYRSDNATLARLGVPAHTISSVQIDQDKTYHTVKDEFELLDMPHFTSMIRAIALAAQGVVSGEDTPTRVDKALVK